MHNTKVDTYFNMYADKFGLKKHIHFNTEVSKGMSTKPSHLFIG